VTLAVGYLLISKVGFLHTMTDFILPNDIQIVPIELASSTEAYIDELANAREVTLKRNIMEELKTLVQTAVSNELEIHKITMTV